jgi:hypothetical protein
VDLVIPAHKDKDETPRTRGNVPIPVPRTKNSSDDNEEEFEDEHVLLGPFTQLTVDRSSTSQYCTDYFFS